MVPVTPDTPSKHPKTSPSHSAVAAPPYLDLHQLVSLIQTTDQDSVSSNLKPADATVEAVVERSTAQDTRLAKVEHAITSLEELESRHSRRLDTMQEELVQIQKSLASPGRSGPFWLVGPLGTRFLLT